MQSDPRKLRHDLRNVANTLLLAVAAMELEKRAAEKIEWLDAIIAAAESGIRVIEEMIATTE